MAKILEINQKRGDLVSLDMGMILPPFFTTEHTEKNLKRTPCLLCTPWLILRSQQDFQYPALTGMLEGFQAIFKRIFCRDHAKWINQAAFE